MKLYEIRMYERFIPVSKSGYYNASKFMQLDNIGFILEYDKSQENDGSLTPNFIRGHLVGGRKPLTFIEANTKEEAIEKCKEIFKEGLNIGGEGENKKAQRILYDTIKEIPDCGRRKSNKEGELICDIIDFDDIWGMCCFEGYDSPEFCPIEWDDDKQGYYLKIEGK